MRPSGFLSAREAGDQLGLSEQRIRVLVSSGAIHAEKIGGRWLIPRESLEDASSQQRLPGRPMNAQSAWGYLWLLSGRQPEWLSPSGLSRLRHRRRVDSEELVVSVRKRAGREDLRVHPGVFKSLKEDPRLVNSGVSALREHAVDLTAAEDADVYVRASDRDAVVADYQLVESDRSNLRLRPVDDRCWPFEDGVRVAPAAVVAVDLLESRDQRVRKAGSKLLLRGLT